MREPNIIFILCDDLGWGDCGCYGQRTLKTPRIDALAEEGVRFTQFYSTSPVCSPARTSIMTGLHSGHLPIRELADCYLPDEYWNIAKMFQKAGYVAECFGKYGVGSGMHHDEPLRKGFDGHFGYNCMCHAHNYFPPFLIEDGKKFFLKNVPPEGDVRQWQTGVGVAEQKVEYTPDIIEAKVMDFLDENANKPFFLFYCTNLPHANNEGKGADGMEVDAYGDFENQGWNDNEKGFARMIQRIDQTVGRVVDKVKSLGLEDDTVIIFGSDNGPHQEGGHHVKTFDSAGPFQGYKRSLHEGGLRVPFIVRCPKRIPGGRTSEHLGYYPDLMPTFTEAAGLNIAHYSDGISLWPMLTGNTEYQATHAHLYFEYQNQRAVRSGEFKYFRNQDGTDALYHLPTDIHEDCDVKEQYATEYHQLKAVIGAEHLHHMPRPVEDGGMRSYHAQLEAYL